MDVKSGPQTSVRRSVNTRIEDQNRAYYDAEAAVYDDNRYGSLKGQRLSKFHVRVIKQSLGPHLAGGAKVLEVGCGTGRLLAALSTYEPKLYGIDASRGMLEIARQRLASRRIDAELCEGNAAALPYEDGYFDAVYSILVINLIPTYEAVLREIARVLKPGGTLLFNIPNLASVYLPGGIYVNLRQRTVTSNRAGHRYSHWFLPGEWKGALARSGLKYTMVLGQPPHVTLVNDARPLSGGWLSMALAKSIYISATHRDGQLRTT
jgi:ubiquinone/menaquinone biosynthesis C-methylase UbiE